MFSKTTAAQALSPIKRIAAKASRNIILFAIPKRSPDLNVLDYAIWRVVNRRMRAQERKFPVSKRETRLGYIARLRRAASRIPSSTIDKAIGQMKARCIAISLHKGHQITDGLLLKTV